jgi:oleate hydratase
MFAFEEWHSALEMRRYFLRFVHHIGGINNFSALKFTRYNQYESLILPLVKYLEPHGVKYIYDAKVTNVKFDISANQKVATSIEAKIKNKPTSIPLTKDDLVFITNGSCTENSSLGDHTHPAIINTAPGAC